MPTRRGADRWLRAVLGCGPMTDLLDKARRAGVEVEIKADDATGEVAIKVQRGTAYGYVTLRTVGELRAWLAGME